MSDEAFKNVYDMDGPNFDSEAYVNKTLRECTLKDVMNVETAIIRYEYKTKRNFVCFSF